MTTLIIQFVCVSTLISAVSALECYTCDKADNNHYSCVGATRRCDQFQDACTTYVRWGVPQYWTPRGDRVYYISKDCDTRQGCERRQAAVMSHCKRDWYNDWACVECCTGDLCNYYVTLGAESARASWAASLVVALLSVTMARLLNWC